MILLNLGCGNTRPGPPWVNMDTLFEVLAKHPTGDAAAKDLSREGNYIEHDVIKMPWPFEHESLDGILASHIFEHFDCQIAVILIRECYRLLRPGGILRVAVPDAAYFRAHYHEDKRGDWMRVFGEDNDVSDKMTYMSVALFFAEHLQTYSEHGLWCQLVEAGFRPELINFVQFGQSAINTDVSNIIAGYDNRSLFSLFAEVRK